MRKPAGALVAGVVSTALWLSILAVGEAQSPLRIGASISQTGPYAAPAQNQLRGYRLCVKHTNERGGVLGRKLELVVEDDQSQPATAARIYEKLITQDKVDAILGPYASPITEAVADVTGVVADDHLRSTGKVNVQGWIGPETDQGQSPDKNRVRVVRTFRQRIPAGPDHYLLPQI